MQQITPDFIIDTNDDGTITFSLNRGNIPQLNDTQVETLQAEIRKLNPKPGG